MEQKTGVSPLYDEFFRGYGAEIRLFCPEFCPNSTYKQSSTPSFRTRVAMTDVKDRVIFELVSLGRRGLTGR
jgi:hypothetical protein